MRPEQYPTSKLVQWLEKERILTLDRVAEALGRPRPNHPLPQAGAIGKPGQLLASRALSHPGPDRRL